MDEKKIDLFSKNERKFLENCNVKNKTINEAITMIKNNKDADYKTFAHHFFNNSSPIIFNFSRDTYVMHIPENDYFTHNINDEFSGTFNPILIILMIITDHSRFYIKMNDNYYKFLEVFFINFTDIMYWTNKLRIDEIVIFIEDIFRLRQPLPDKLPSKFEIIEELGGMTYIENIIDTELKSYCSRYSYTSNGEKQKVYKIINGNNSNDDEKIRNFINHKYNADHKILRNVSAMINRICAVLINRSILRLNPLDIDLITDYFENKNKKQTYVFSIFMYYHLNALRYPFALKFDPLNNTEFNNKWLKNCKILSEQLSDMIKSNLFLMNQF